MRGLRQDVIRTGSTGMIPLRSLLKAVGMFFRLQPEFVTCNFLYSIISDCLITINRQHQANITYDSDFDL